MAFHLVLLLLALALTSAAFAIATDIPVIGATPELEWAAAKVSLARDSLALGMIERIGDSPATCGISQGASFSATIRQRPLSTTAT